MVTHIELFALMSLIVAIISLVVTIYHNGSGNKKD